MSGPPPIAPITIKHLSAERVAEFCPGLATLGFADPPFNWGKDYGDTSNDSMSDELYLEALGSWVRALSDAVRPGGMVMYLVPEQWADETSAYMKQYVGPRHRRVIWHETFAQYNRHELTRGHRHLFMHFKPGGPQVWNPDEIRIPSERLRMGDKRANPEGRIPDDVWKIRRLQGTSKDRVGWHACQMPPEIHERIIRGWTNPGDLIVEQFSGSASMPRVANRWGRRYFGGDINPEYVSNGLARVHEEPYGWQLATPETRQEAWKRRNEI